MATLEDLDANGVNELALLARELSDNPATRKGFLGLVKTARPNMPVPELEIDAALAKNSHDNETRVAQLENRLAERDMTAELERRRNKLIAEGKATADDIPEIEKLMLDKGISNHETAADFFAWSRQAATPTPTGYAANVLDQNVKDRLKPYWRNPQVAARDEAAKALNEIRKGGPRVLS